MESCLLCLELTNESVGSVQVNSKEWDDLNIKSLIEKHLWALSTPPSSWICSICLEELHDFHAFYKRIESAHSSIGLILKIENPIELCSPLDFVTQETVMPQIAKEECIILKEEPNTDLWDDDEPLMPTNKLKRPATMLTASKSKKVKSNKAATAKINKNRHGKQIKIRKAGEPETRDSNKDDDDDANKTKAAKQLQMNEDKDKFLSKNFNLICEICEMSMENFHTLCIHFNEEHGQRGYAICCGIKFFERRLILDHVHQHLDPDFLKCKQCGKVFTNRRYLTVHRGRHEKLKRKMNKPKQSRPPLSPHQTNDSDNQPPFPDKKDLNNDFDKNIKTEESSEEDDAASKAAQTKKKKDSIQINVEKDKFLAKNFKLNCVICEMPMENFQALCLHFEEEHGEPGYVMCCDIKFFERRLILDHVHQHLDPDFLKCKKCGKVFTNRRYLTVHMGRHEKSERKKNMPKQTKKDTQNDLDKNSETEESSEEEDDADIKAAKIKKKKDSIQINAEKDNFLAKNFKLICIICEAPMENFQVLCAHFELEHGEPGYVVCCDIKFFERRLILDHVHQHLDPDYLKCKHCDKVFSNRRYLTIHSRIHDPSQRKRYCCDICGLSYTTPHTLICHKQTKHISEEEKLFPCLDCGKRFGTKWLHKEHTKAVHTSTVNCDICGLRLVNSYALRKHKYNKHSEGKTVVYTCPICSRVSTNKYAHINHVRNVHQTGYNHKCNICERAFKRPRGLKEHLATHTGSALYACPWCPKTFNSISNIAQHRRKWHPQEEENRDKFSGTVNVKLKN